MPVRGRARPRQGRRPASRRSLASTADACGALKSRARPVFPPPGTPRRQAPARGRPCRRRFRRLRLGVGALRQRDEDVEGGALDAVRDAHERGLDDLRRRRRPTAPTPPTDTRTAASLLVSYVSVTKAHNAEPGSPRGAPTETDLGDVRMRCVDGAASTAWGARASALRLQDLI